MACTDTPKDSEIPVERWLKQIGATEIRYVGRGHGEGPPDFTCEFMGKKIAVEVRLLEIEDGWGRTAETAFHRRIEKLIRMVEAEEKIVSGFDWICQYDEREPLPPKSSKDRLKQRIREAVRATKACYIPWREFQISPQDRIAGRGIVLIAVGPETVNPTLNWWGTDIGRILYGDELGRAIASAISAKARKVRKDGRAKGIDFWWLVLDDNITYAMDRLSPHSDAELLDYAETEDIDVWGKIVLLSRYITTPQGSPLWFRPLWQDPAQPPLPASPPTPEPYRMRF